MLTTIVFLPLLFAILIAVCPKDTWVRPAALIFSTVEFILSLGILLKFDKTSAALQLQEKFSWVSLDSHNPKSAIFYFLGIDGISLWLVLLTTFLTPIIVLGSWHAIETKVRSFHAALFALMTAMLGSFLAMDLVLFYIFFELSLVPMYFMIGIWGGPRRIYATLKFFIYTMLGSLPMLLGIVYLMYAHKEVNGFLSADVLSLYKLEIPFMSHDWVNPQTLLFFAFSLGFAIKVPMFPVHTWLPDAHVEAPTPGSVILAGVMLKMGTYGFIRFVIPLFPEATNHYSWVFILLGVIGIVYGALVAMIQPDIKKLVAYSSVSHMGYVMIGLFALNSYGVTGAVYQMLNHGISTGALFLLVGMIYERTHSREISKYGGLAMSMPVYTILFLIITMSSIAVPLTNGFVGEFLILLGTFAASPALGIVAVSGVVLGAVYMLWMVKRVFFGEKGELVSDESHPLSDLSCREKLVMAPLIIMVFWMGIFPGHFLDWSRASIENFVKNRTAYELVKGN